MLLDRLTAKNVIHHCVRRATVYEIPARKPNAKRKGNSSKRQCVRVSNWLHSSHWIIFLFLFSLLNFRFSFVNLYVNLYRLHNRWKGSPILWNLRILWCLCFYNYFWLHSYLWIVCQKEKERKEDKPKKGINFRQIFKKWFLLFKKLVWKSL